MAEHIADWERYLREEAMNSPRTVERYRRVLDRYTIWLGLEYEGQSIDIAAIPKRKIEGFLRFESNGFDDPSKSTWNLQLAGLRSFYQWMYEEEKIDANPALKVRRHKESRSSRVPLSWEEFLHLVDTVSKAGGAYKKRNLAIIQTFFHTGLRVSELVSLSIDQVDLDGYVFLDVRTKGDKRVHVPFNDVVRGLLEDYLEEREKDGMLEGRPALFLSDRGTRLAVRSVQEMLKQAGKRAGLKKPVSPHVLRHSSASSLSAMGTPIEVVQKVLGHADIRTTMRYVHVDTERKQEAVHGLGAQWKKQRRKRRPSRKPVLEHR